jgi:predicted DNA binding protein
MGTVVDATVSSDQFALQHTFDELPGAEFETVPIVAKNDEHVVPFLWGSAPDLTALHEELLEDGSTESVTRLVEKTDRSLYRITWSSRIRIIMYILGLENGTLLDARGRNGQWELRILFPSHDSVSATYDLCKAYDVDLTIRRVKGIVQSIDRSGNELTDKQHEALAAGVESDYYRIPRGHSLEELANELDISHQALSERLRRGHRTLIEQTLR